jgi:hypothetical protein
VLHAVEDATQLHANETVEATALDVGRMCLDNVDADSVEGYVQRRADRDIG